MAGEPGIDHAGHAGRSLELPGDPGTDLAAAPLLGGIALFAGTFAPRGWAFCEGQLLAISQNDALFALLGTTYGGDGRTTFGLPDLRGRIPMAIATGSTRMVVEKSRVKR